MDLKTLEGIPAFSNREECKKFSATKDRLDVLQVNVGKVCNLTCKHCHIEAGPTRTEVMSKKVMEYCLDVFEKNAFTTLDVTGGSPEMNPNFEWFVGEASNRRIHTIVRTNLVILSKEGYRHLPEYYAVKKVEICASLPCYTEENTDLQRGQGVFSSCVSVLQTLNKLGYGKDPNLVINLVYNPGGAVLPPYQDTLTSDYKKELSASYGISFNRLYTIANNPIGRFGDFLQRSGNMKPYFDQLVSAFNPSTVENMMCRSQVSVGWDGTLYDCDFNQALGLPMNGINHIRDAKGKTLTKRTIVFGNHCYPCTAGSGSSCAGATSA